MTKPFEEWRQEMQTKVDRGEITVEDANKKKRPPQQKTKAKSRAKTSHGQPSDDANAIDDDNDDKDDVNGEPKTPPRHVKRDPPKKLTTEQILRIRKRVDPALTAQGYLQAKEVFRRLLHRLEGQRVAAFVSPLRRCIGTALMMTVGAHRSTFWSEDGERFPLVVMNGLADPAAAVRRVGGAKRAVALGFIDCGAMKGNDRTESTPFVYTLRDIHRKIHETLRTKPCGPARPVQFRKEAERHGEYNIMLESICITDEPIPAVSEKAAVSTIPVREVDDFAETNQFLAAAKRAVKQTIDCRNDVCLLVSHREAIRELAWNVCKSKAKFKTPYCCVGVFDATLCSHKHNSQLQQVTWSFRGVVLYDKL